MDDKRTSDDMDGRAGGDFSGSAYGAGDGRGRGAGFNPGARFMDDLARFVTDAAGVAQGARREVETVVKSQGERFMSQMDLVQRDEFEAVREMAAKARMENESLRAELETLKAQMAKKPASKATKAAKSGD